MTSGDDLMLTGLIDDDDAWSREVVSMIRKRCSSWLKGESTTRGLGITFEHGLEWVMYDMLDVDRLWKGGELERAATIRSYLFPFLGTSVFVLSRLADRVCAVSAAHSRMGDYLTENEYDVEIISTDRPMWLYCRHKQADSGIQKSHGEDLRMSLAELATEFGIDKVRTAQYLASADEYSYSLIKRIWKHRRRYEGELREVRQQLSKAVAEQGVPGRLRARQAELEGHLNRLTECVVGEFEDAPTDQPDYEPNYDPGATSA